MVEEKGPEASHLLIRHDAVGLQWSRVPAEQASSRPVVFTEDGAVDVMKAITRDQAVPTGGTSETLQKE